MVDLVTNRTIDLTKLAMDGLTERQKAISSNVANVMTPNYQRKDVQFEDQLRSIIDQDDSKESIKLKNSIEFNPSSLDEISYTSMSNQSSNRLTPQQAKYLQNDLYGGFNPQVADDTTSGGDSQGNNVNVESEAMNMAKTGLRYNVLANLEGKQFGSLKSAIKGEVS